MISNMVSEPLHDSLGHLLSVSENKETRVWNEVIDSQVYVVERAKTMFQNWQDIGRICDTYCNSDKKKM
ncbi:hypothetical protein MTR_2g017815 [Medicago truncatula]|uniref:Uncharacterized protein n=1 Tax=Medicago truncatula TaxID=3880 RepID=A0A072V3Q2_MEDTR|nr:hypothetical protein MTR_2g017815 [Medicago truncatula]